MTKALTIITLLFSAFTYGQASKNIYTNVQGLTVVDSINWTDVVGGFIKTDGYGGYNYRLDSNMRFDKIDFSCMAKFKVDSGAWTIQNSNTVVLKSSKQTLHFDILKFDQYYFFTLPTQRQSFVQAIKKAPLKFKDFKPTTMNGKRYTIEFMIGHTLVEKYFAKKI
jgi:hypothetical protein